MQLSTRQLEAFFAVARMNSFTKAAQRLHLTQPALSQRIRKLEESLDTSLFVRAPEGIRLTESGHLLLRYCQSRESLDNELAGELAPTTDGELGGALRIAGYSSIMRSAVIPALAPLLRAHPAIHCEFLVREMGDLPGILKRAEADYVILDRALDMKDVRTHKLGREVYVAIASKHHRERDDVYLDHDPEDKATQWFFCGRKNAPIYKRSYMCDVYGILSGVTHGLGRAVMPRHLIGRGSGVRIVDEHDPRSVDVVLHCYEQTITSRLQVAVQAALIENSHTYLDVSPG